MTAINAALQSFNAACPNPNTATLEQLETLVSTMRSKRAGDRLARTSLPDVCPRFALSSIRCSDW